jgi:hypothetical protein
MRRHGAALENTRRRIGGQLNTYLSWRIQRGGVAAGLWPVMSFGGPDGYPAASINVNRNESLKVIWRNGLQWRGWRRGGVSA